MRPGVVAAIIVKDNKVLLGKRSLSKEKAAGYWCPISGKIKEGENQKEAIEREVFEEVGLTVKAIENIKSFPSHDNEMMIHWWNVEILSGDAYLKNDEHSEIGWFDAQSLQKLQPTFREDVELFLHLLATQ